eukprot:ANDGO_05534.mRNA.1 hypothetical protein
MSSHSFPQTAKTDGVSVSFVPEYETMRRPRAADDEMVPREPHPRRRRGAAGREDQQQQQQPRQVPADMTLVGIDPGRTNILTAFDGTSVRSEMRNQWYHATGANAERKWMEQRSGRVKKQQATAKLLDRLATRDQVALFFRFHQHPKRVRMRMLENPVLRRECFVSRGLRHCATVNCPSDRGSCVGIHAVFPVQASWSLAKGSPCEARRK